MHRSRHPQSVKTPKYNPKKKTKRYKEQSPEKVVEFQKAISGIPADKIAYVDETGIDTYLHRPFCRAKRGVKIIGAVSGKKFKRTSIVSALTGNRPIEPLQYGGSMDSVLFESWFEMRLLPALPKNTTIVMDNASFHRKSRLIPLAESTGHTLLFLPPYSPELNLIEHFWAWLKARLRKILHLFDGLDSAISDCFHVR